MLRAVRSYSAKLLGRLLSVRSYEAASGRRWERQATHGRWGDEANAAAPIVRARARHMAVNNPWGCNAVGVWQTALIGAGIVPASGHSNATVRKQLAKAWKAWANSCDADSITDFAGMQAQIVRSLVIDGEAFIQIVDSDTGPKLRQIPSEQVDSNYSMQLSDSRQIIAGIEFDAEGNRVAYHINRDRLAGFGSDRIRIPAESILHVFCPNGPGQTRGVSWFAPVLLTLGEFDQLSDAQLVAAKISAMHAGFIVDLNGTGGSLPYDGTQNGSVLDGGLEPGTIKILPSGTDIRFNSPLQASQTIEFAGLQLRAVAAGLGIPEFLLTGDYSKANYSSLRSALVSFRQRIEQLQFQILVPQLLRPVWQRFVLSQALLGELQGDFEDALEVEFYPPALPWVDPKKDAEALAVEIAAGLKSRRQAVASLGYSIEDLDSEIAADRERETALGLTFGTKPKAKEHTNAQAA